MRLLELAPVLLPARPRFLPPERRSRTDDAWSEAEEQVSQILRNLRGLSPHSDSERQSYLDNDRSRLPLNAYIFSLVMHCTSHTTALLAFAS